MFVIVGTPFATVRLGTPVSVPQPFAVAAVPVLGVAVTALYAPLPALPLHTSDGAGTDGLIV